MNQQTPITPPYPSPLTCDRIYSGVIKAERAKTFIQAIIGTFVVYHYLLVVFISFSKRFFK